MSSLPALAPSIPDSSIRRVGLLFSGGPAPAANAVISAASSALRRSGCDVVGIRHGYGALMQFDAQTRPLVPGEDFDDILDRDLRPLRRVYDGLRSLDLDALVSIGGDDTLRTANLLHQFQTRLPAGAPRVRIVHVPKTIDNDYGGIDFTFGFFTAVGVMAEELLNLRSDAMATNSYYVVETMGRRAGWLAYGVAVAGEAHLVVAVEDVVGDLATDETVTDPETGAPRTVKRLAVDRLVDRVVDLIVARERRGKRYGTVVLAEGLAELLPAAYLRDVGHDDHGHLSLGRLDIGRRIASMAAAEYEKRTGKPKKLVGVQLGYESRCSPPHAFDVLLGSQLGLGAAYALVEKGLDGHMVSVAGQLDLRYLPFADVIDPVTLRAPLRLIDRGSDFHRLATQLGTKVPPRGPEGSPPEKP
jgi:6-phosphofructokinase 1